MLQSVMTSFLDLTGTSQQVSPAVTRSKSSRSQSADNIVNTQPSTSTMSTLGSKKSTGGSNKNVNKSTKNKSKPAKNRTPPSSPSSISAMLDRAFATSTPAHSSMSDEDLILSLREQIKDMTKYKHSLENQVEVLSAEITNKSKSEKKLVTEVKRLTCENDKLRRQCSSIRRLAEKNKSSDTSNSLANESAELQDELQARLNSLRDNPVTHNVPTSNNNPVARPSHNQGAPIPVIVQSRTSSVNTQIHPESHTVGAPIPVIGSRVGNPIRPAQPRPSQPRNPIPQSKVKFTVMGTSISQGSGAKMSNQGAKATVYSYSGFKIAHLRQRVDKVFKKDRVDKTPIVLQCGGNDSAEMHEDRVIDQYEGLIKDVKRQRPSAPIVVSVIPFRKNNLLVNRRIAVVNDYLRDRAQHRDNVHCVDAVPKCHVSYYTSKGIHFNEAGKELYAKNMVRAMRSKFH